MTIFAVSAISPMGKLHFTGKIVSDWKELTYYLSNAGYSKYIIGVKFSYGYQALWDKQLHLLIVMGYLFLFPRSVLCWMDLNWSFWFLISVDFNMLLWYVDFFPKQKCNLKERKKNKTQPAVILWSWSSFCNSKKSGQNQVATGSYLCFCIKRMS